MEYIALVTIRPLELLFETIFAIANSYIGKPGITIILLSIVVNLLVLPLYERADKMQKEEDAKQKRMEKWKKHINKTFRGDEKMMILQTYYRQNNYNPMSILLQSVPLLLQIPFFIAAYRFLSNLELLNGASFGPIANLGKEDAMFMIGNFPVNVLPILMTLINVVAGIIYTKNQAWKNRIQMLLTALVFLVLLYRSPAGLVFYWTCNNIFSLIKNIVAELLPKIPKKEKTVKADVPWDKKDMLIFFGGALFLILFTGGYITTNIVKASTSEFVDVGSLSNPVRYAGYTILYAFGTFGVWLGIYYLLADKKGRRVWNEAIWMLSAAGLINYLVAGKHLGTISAFLKYTVPVTFGKKKNLLAFLLCAVVCVGIHFLFLKKKVAMKAVAAAAVLGMGILVAMNCIQIGKDYKALEYLTKEGDAGLLKLSRNGKNVIVIMMDRAKGPVVPYLIKEKPELTEMFDGFTYYPETVSFGPYTKLGAPALYGGYEYTPERMNERDSEYMVTKHNESLRVLPVLFSENGYDVTVFDPVCAGYQWIPDLSIYDDYPEINTFNTQGKFNDLGPEDATEQDSSRRRNFFCHSIMKITPLFLQKFIYDNGLYNEPSYSLATDGDPRYVSAGYDQEFLDWYLALRSYPDITVVEDGEENNFLLLMNGTAHSDAMLQKPDYLPQKYVDNTAYAEDEEFYTIDGRTLGMDTPMQQREYCDNMAALLTLGKWLDYLKENGCYDNSRIIVVADHGRNANHFDLISDEGTDLEFFLPLLLVKDFNETGFKISEEFMTNADTPSLAVEGLIEDAKNPFSGNPLDGHEKSEEPHILYSDEWSVYENDRTAFREGQWYTVSGDVLEKESWKYLGTR